MTVWKKAMSYLGLGPDDAYDDYDLPTRAGACGREARHGSSGGHSPDQEYGVRAVPRQQRAARRGLRTCARRGRGGQRHVRARAARARRSVP